MSRRMALLVSGANTVVLAGIVVPVAMAVARLGSDKSWSILEPILLMSFAVAALLMLVMVFACSRNSSLSPSQRRRWELGLLIGGPVTSLAYFIREAKNGA